MPQLLAIIKVIVWHLTSASVVMDIMAVSVKHHPVLATWQTLVPYAQVRLVLKWKLTQTGNGDCVLYNYCVCNKGFSGADCSSITTTTAAPTTTTTVAPTTT